MSDNPAPGTDTACEEVRFAVVMYGGVSLAIYINGVAQELLHLVRSTAANTGAGLLSGTERVYRKLGYLLGHPPQCTDFDAAERLLNESAPTSQVRFVVDIISGTSAGGINGIFLAKALANAQQITQLEDLWTTKGDIAQLINDKRSLDGPLALREPPASLLNSDRMYLELVRALDGMGPKPNEPTVAQAAAYVDEVDLFVTTTDLHGLTLPIRLADKLVYERRHRNVFHFAFSEGRNDFTAQHNPFLAYAARCTSAFPFAFEPMRLCDGDTILDSFARYGDAQSKSDSSRWKKFYRDYLQVTGIRSLPFPMRSFGDGGYLDNKPFGYATDMLSRRAASVPVTRKLLYIEPSPEHPEDQAERADKPDAISNTILAVVTLPQYETIREDLERVRQRNRLIERVNRILNGLEQDVEGAGVEAIPPLTDEKWAALDLAESINAKGGSRGYGAYHRLEIAAVTDDLANLITRVAGLDERSDYFLIVRSIIKAWREHRYVEHHTPRDDRPTMNTFLYEFNLAYPLRRIAFLRTKIDQLYRLDPDAFRVLRRLNPRWWPAGQQPPEEEIARFRRHLLTVKQRLNEAHRILREIGRSARSRAYLDDGADKSNLVAQQVTAFANALAAVVAQPTSTAASPADAIIDYFLGGPVEVGGGASAAVELRAVRRAADLLKENQTLLKNLDELGQTLAGMLGAGRQRADAICQSVLKSPGEPAADAANDVLRHYYEHYDDYDMVLFPILYGTDVGEPQPVDVIRISPEDATALIDERTDPYGRCKKLAGTALGHFGGFLERRWRKNDILWGRLDGAERIITSLLSDRGDLARQLIGEAHAAIVLETIEGMGTSERLDLLVESLMRPDPKGQPNPTLLTQFIRHLEQNATAAQGKALHDANIDERSIRDHYLRVYPQQCRLDPEPTLRSTARATTVVGKMLAGLSHARNVSSRYGAWLARLGQIFWSLVEVAVPRSIPHFVFRHWLKLLYFVEVLLIVLGTFLVTGSVQQVALAAFGLTATAHLLAGLLNDVMEGRRRWQKMAIFVGITITAVLVLCGVVMIWALFGDGKVWDWLEHMHAAITSSPGQVRPFVVAAFAVFLAWIFREDLKTAVLDVGHWIQKRRRSLKQWQSGQS